MSTLMAQSVARDSEERASYVAAVIMADLHGKRSGKCPCYISATTGISERLLYEFLEEMLAIGWVEVHLPADPDESLAIQVRNSKSQAASKPEEDAKAVWRDFFRRMGERAPTPRYYIRLTQSGESELRRFRLF